MGKRVRISNSNLNSYGTRVLTEGMSIEQYNRNPVLLYMHRRGDVIGYVKDVRKEGDEVTGELVFDCATSLSQQCQKQWEFGSLKMVSAGLDILEMSDEDALLVQGQRSPTVTRSKLFEVSLVDIGANDDAIVLQRDGQAVTLGRDGLCPLPLLEDYKNSIQMENKAIALQLGLAETATTAEISAAIGLLLEAKQENEQLKQEREHLTLAAIEAEVDKAIADNRLSAQHRQQFVELGQQIGLKKLEGTLLCMNPQVKLTNMLGAASASAGAAGNHYTKLSEVPAAQLAEMREKNPEEYARLYKAEYGMECEY